MRPLLVLVLVLVHVLHLVGRAVLCAPDIAMPKRKADVRFVCTVNVPLEETIDKVDGTIVEPGDRLLLVAQDNPAENGIYQAAADPRADDDLNGNRAADAATAADFKRSFFVREVTTGTDWRYHPHGKVTLGTSPLRFERAHKSP